MKKFKQAKNGVVFLVLIALLLTPLGIQPARAAADFVVITGIIDGSLAGGTPKALEIYVNGTVDLSNFSIERSTNGGDFGSTTALSGTYTDEFVYLVGTAYDGVAQFIAVFGESGDFINRIPLSVVNGNGNDAFRIIDSSLNVVDQVWYENITDSYIDSYWYRIAGSGPDEGWVSGNWSAGGNNLLDGMAPSEIAVEVPFGTYSRMATRTIPTGGGSAELAGVTITNNSTNSCEFSIIKHFVPPGGDPADSGEMPLQWDINSTGCGTLNLNLTFHYSESELAQGNSITEANLEIYRNLGDTSWENICDTLSCSLDVANNLVGVTGVQELSSWTIGDSTTLGNHTPTAITLSGISGKNQFPIAPLLLGIGCGIIFLGARVWLYQRRKMR